MDRRSFLGGLTVAIAAPVLAVAAKASPMEAASTHGSYGYQIAWSGWTNVANQNIRFGVWYAKKSADDQWYSTTLGMVGRMREFDAIDLTHRDNMPVVTYQTTELAARQVQALALRRLMRSLDTGRPATTVEYAENTTRHG